MLSEINDVKQIENEGYRRWFSDNYFDLIIWYGDEKIIGFQLCYDKQGSERSLTWIKNRGFSHNKIDDGEKPGHTKMTPILVADGVFDKEKIRMSRVGPGLGSHGGPGAMLVAFRKA